MDNNEQKDKDRENRLVPSTRSIVVNSEKSNYINRKIVKKKIYNAFNYSMLPEEYQKINLAIGITSPNKGEGKTVTASNLAVSFALAYKKKTVLIDLNMKNPCLHKVFGTDLKPGLRESFRNGSIFLSQTRLANLYLLPAGWNQGYALELEDLGAIREIISSLKKEFEIIIFDMNPVFPIEDFPAVFTNEVDGLLVVIDTRKTKYASVKKMFRHIDKDQTMGFVFNRVDEDPY